MKITTTCTLLLVSLFTMTSCKNEDLQEISDTVPELSNQTVNVSESILDNEIITTLSANDTDGDELIYTIVTNDDDLFEITTTGDLSLLEGKILNYENKTSYTITVNVSDGVNNVESTITINVTDVVEESKATKALLTGITASSDDSFNYLTIDLDASAEESTSIAIENYESRYSYQLKLTGVYTQETHYVDVIEDSPSVAEKQSAVVPTTSTTLYLDLSTLEMESDFYTAVLLEKDSDNELSISSSTTTDSRTLRFIDQSGSNFYTTIRASQSNGGISSLGHPFGHSIKVEFYQLSIAKAFVYTGNATKISFYTVSDQTLVKAVSTYFSSSSTSVGIGPAYYTTINYISPSGIGLTKGTEYLVRAESYNDATKTTMVSPFQKFKVAN